MIQKIIFDTNNYIYTDYGVGSTGGITITVNTTNKMICYPTSGNPFGINYPSYIMVPETYHVIPLNQNIDCFILHTTPTYTSTAYLCVPEIVNGQTIILKDYNSFLNKTNVQLSTWSGSVNINGSSYDTLNTAGLIKKCTYCENLNDIMVI